MIPSLTIPKPRHTPTGIGVELHDVCVAYDRKPVLWDVDAVLPAGRLIAIIGPNGSGKSTLLKSILGLVRMSSGTIEVFGRPVREVRTQIGYVPQRESVDWDFPVSVMDVVLMGRYAHLGWFKRPGDRDKVIARACLGKVGMEAYESRQIGQLSGGQQQRVFLARALAQEASLYLMDEPFAGVDAATERAIIEVLRTLRQEGRTIVVVHHDLQSVPAYFDHVLLLNQRLIACGEVGDVFNSLNLQKTYGGRLTLMDEAAEAIRRADARPGRHP